MMELLLFWGSYALFLFSLLMWSCEHPLSIGALVLSSYIIGSGVVCVGVSFIVGIFLFLTGVSGMMVAFLYVVALCPNPVFKGQGVELSFVSYVLGWLFVVLVLPGLSLSLVGGVGFSVEGGSISEEIEWLREPSMYGGLSLLMPFLGGILFLCMVSVVSLCSEQKQCLGGQGLMDGGSFSLSSKRSYMES